MVTSRRLKETLSYIFQWEHWRREETQWTTMVKTPDIIEPEMKLYSNLVQGSSPYSTESHCFRWSYVTREKTTELRVLVAQSSFLESQGSNWQQAVGDLDAASLPTQPFGDDPTLHLLPLNFPTFLSLWQPCLPMLPCLLLTVLLFPFKVWRTWWWATKVWALFLFHSAFSVFLFSSRFQTIAAKDGQMLASYLAANKMHKFVHIFSCVFLPFICWFGIGLLLWLLFSFILALYLQINET